MASSASSPSPSSASPSLPSPSSASSSSSSATTATTPTIAASSPSPFSPRPNSNNNNNGGNNGNNSGNTANGVVRHGIVKQVLSGDTLVVRGRPSHGPPPEKQITLAYVTAPRWGRRDAPEEPFAWESREFLRKWLIGKDVSFRGEYTTQSGREYASVFVGSDDVAARVLSQGWAKLREGGKSERERNELAPLETAAQIQELGIWTKDEAARKKAMHSVSYSFDGDMREFVEKHKSHPVPAIVERVRDGSTLQVLLLPYFQQVNLIISGIKCPVYRKDVPDQPDLIEPYAAEAKFFTEARLLQQEVKVVFEGVSNNKSFVGSVVFPAGNIAEALLREGLAKVVDWSITMVSTGPKSLRDAEKIAKQSRVRLWKDYNPKVVAERENDYSARVTKILNGESMIVTMHNGEERKISLSSIRQPRAKEAKEAPYQPDAKEFLRARLIGQKVNVKVDYVKPPEQGMEERVCATVVLDGKNIGESLVASGLATVLRHRQDDENRSSSYDQLLIAEESAVKGKKGLHNPKPYDPPRIVDASENATRAKQFLPGFQRKGKISAIVEYISNGSRFKLFVPRDACRMGLVFSGVSCGRVASTPQEKSEPFATEALCFSSEKCLQHEVEVAIEGVDRGGSFIGQIVLKGGQLLAALLLEEGLGKLHEPSADQSSYATQLFAAQSKAKSAKKGMWLNYDETKEQQQAEESKSAYQKPGNAGPGRREYVKVVISQIINGGHFFVQAMGDNVHAFEELMDNFRAFHETSSSTAGDIVDIKRGALCSAKSSEDNQWYRGRIQASLPDDQCEIFFMDFGNTEILSVHSLRSIPAEYSSFPPQAQECVLAGIFVPALNDDFGSDAAKLLSEYMDKPLVIDVISRVEKAAHVVLYEEGVVAKAPKDESLFTRSVNAQILEEGLGYVLSRRDRHLQELIAELQPLQEEAKRQHLCVWRYGDCTPDDERGSPATGKKAWGRS